MLMRLRHTWMLVCALLLAGCGASGVQTDGGAAGVPTGGGGTSTPVPIELPSAAMTIDQLPRITGPVVSGGISNISAAPQKSHDSTTPAGVKIALFTNADFPAGSSEAACDTTNEVQLNLAASSAADYSLCLIQYAFSTAGTEATAAYYDGEYHVFRLYWSEGGYSQLVRVLLDRDGDIITDFKMQTCQGSNQVWYTEQQRNGTAFTARAVSANANDSFLYDVAVTGTVNDDHQFTSKQVETNTNRNVDGTSWCESNITQTATDLTESGSCMSVSGSSTQTSRIYAALQLLDHNDPAAPASYDVHKLAMGDGAAIIWRGDADSPPFLQGWTWNGSMLVPDAASSYLASVRDQSPATVGAQFTIDFTSDQRWNCSGTSEQTFTFEGGDAYDACGKYIDIFSLEYPSCEDADGTPTP